MNEGAIVSLIAMLGWLALMVASYRSYQVNASQTIRMVLIWASIFVGVAFLFSVFM